MSCYQMSCYRNVLLPKSPVTEMSCYRKVLLPKCPVTEMSITKVSLTEMSFTEMSWIPLVQCFCLWNCNSLKTALPFYNLNTADQDNRIINYMRYHIFYDNACSIYYVQNRCLFRIDRYTNHVLLRYFAMRCCNLFIYFLRYVA